MRKVLHQIFFFFLFLCGFLQDTVAQGGGFSFDLVKPKKFESKKLGSEKTQEKKFGVVRRFTQNGVTKFNWNFNASTRLQLVIDRAKAAHKDNYTRLLSFYNYDLTKMQPYSSDLDSVIYKANAGILIHDLRNSWIDNLYMLMGIAHYYKNDLDTAYLTFQYINYAFSPKEKDGYDKPIGSNAYEGGNAFSISTKEKKDVVSKVWTRPPSRNESFIWQIRTYLAKNETAEAAGMIETLKNDPLFPVRLRTDLYEMQAYWFYKQQIYDSAAIYLEKALPNAENNQEEARWEYLIAQMHQRSGNPELAKEFFESAGRKTFDPVMEVYARLNATRQNRADDKAITQNIEALMKMARKDRYTNYRDIIYFTAATMELERKNIKGARQLLLKATQVPQSEGENSQRTEAFLLLGDLSFDIKEYKDAKRFYDSVSINDSSILNPEILKQRKLVLIPIVDEINVLERQDSLQRIAALPEAQRDALVKKLVKQLRKSNGIKEEVTEGAGANSVNKTAGPSDLFNNTKGEWYFDNASLKSKGFTDFKGKWGNRPNTDNWRRSGAISRNNGVREEKEITSAKDLPAGADSVGDISYESLMKNIPLTEEMLKKSKDSMERATFILGKIYFESLEDYSETMTTLESLLEKYPATVHKPEALFMLNYCYNKTGNITRASETKQMLEQQYAGSEYQRMVTNPGSGTIKSITEADMNRRYESIYNSFIEGRFGQALDDKKIADSLYGVNYWTPQLLYIESVYHIKQKQDDQAKLVLQNIIKLYPTSPLSPRAQTMLDVLGRRKEIEEYLTNLKIVRPGEDSAYILNDDSPVKKVIVTVEPPVVPVDSVALRQADSAMALQKLEDSLQAKSGVKQVTAKTKDSVNTGLVKVTPKQMADTFSRSIPGVTTGDTLSAADLQKRADSVALAPGKKQPDTTAKVSKPKRVINSVYTADNEAPHMVMMILDKVDPVYVGEAKNAFNRYNKQNYFNTPIETVNQPLSDSVSLVVISPFANAAAALDYTRKTAEIAGTSIIPWMPKGKFTFVVITPANLALLQTRKDLAEYLKFHGQAY